MAGLREDFTWLLASRAGTLGIGILTGGLVNRGLGPAGRGVLAEMQTWVGLFAVVFGLSLDSALYHFANRVRYGVDDAQRFATALRVLLLAALVAAAAFAAFVRLRPDRVSAETVRQLAPLLVLLAATMLATNLLVLFQALGQIRFAAVAGAVQSVAYLAIVAGVAGWGRLDLDLVIFALIAAQAVMLLVVALRATRGGLWRGGWSGTMARGLLGAGARQHAGTVATFCYLKINQLLVFRVCGPEEAGLFAVALNLAFSFSLVPAAFQSALYPRVIHGTDDFEVTVRSLRFGFYGWGAFSLLLAAFADPILLLYGGGEFRQAAPLFRVFLVASWCLPLSSLIAPYLIKAGAFGISSVSAVSLGAVSIVLNLLLVPRYAALGAAGATALTSATGFVMAIALFAWIARRSPLGFLALRREA